MKTLILYSSRNGQTAKIAEYIKQKLSGDVIVKPLSEQIDLTSFDRIIIGASVRYGHFDASLEKFVNKNRALLETKKTAFFSVNLTARKAGKDTPETNVYTRKLLARLTWQPNLKAVFAGALDYPHYGFFDRIMIQLIMRLTGGETDSRKSIEYTNWQKVDDFVVKIEGL